MNEDTSRQQEAEYLDQQEAEDLERVEQFVRFAQVTQEQFSEAFQANEHLRRTLTGLVTAALLKADPHPAIQVLALGDERSGIGLTFANGTRVSFKFSALSSPAPCPNCGSSPCREKQPAA